MSRIKLIGCLCRIGKRQVVLILTRATWRNFHNSHCNACIGEMCCRHFTPPFVHLLSFPSPVYFLKTTNISFISHFITALALFVWECAPKCVPSSSLFLPLFLLLLLSSTRPPPLTHPPIIEADSASRACTRHTRWLQHLECSLGHYSSPHYRKRRRGGDKEEEEQLR